KSLAAAESSGDAGPISWTPPEDLRAAFARQYGGLLTDAQHVLQILSVAGKAMAPNELARLLGLQDGVVERAALEVLDRGVGRVEEGRLSFKNELHRAYVYYAMGEDRRQYHHAQLAQRLAASPDRNDLQPMLELVHHFIGADMRPQAMETALQAAEVAIARGAPREAERVLTRLLGAYAVTPGSRLRLLLAHSLVAAGQYQRGLDALADWRSDDASSTDLALAALLRAEALQRARLGGDEAIIAASKQAITLAERCGHPAAIAHSRMCLANQYHDLAFFDSSVSCFRALLAPLEALSSPRASVEAYSSIARFALVLASVPEAERAVELCEAAARRSGLWRHEVTALLTRAELYLCKGEQQLAWPLVEAAGVTTGDRSHLLPEAGWYERLQRQF